MRNLCLIFASLAIWLAGAAMSTAQDKVKVEVSFALKARHFTDELTEDQIIQVNQIVRTAIVQAWNSQLGFLDFSTDPAALSLSVELDRLDRGDGLGQTEFGLFVTLSGPDIPADSQIYVTFQTSQNFGDSSISSPDVFARQIVDSFTNEDKRRLVSNLLSRIAISDHADFESPTANWVIQRDRAQLCLGHKSRLIVDGQVPDQLGRPQDLQVNAFVVVIQDIHNWIYARTKDDPEAPVIDLLKAAPADQLKTRKVVVKEYLPCVSIDTASSNGGVQ